MKQLLQNSITWVMKMWPFIAILGLGAKWYAKDQVLQEATKDSIQIVLKNSREMKQTTMDFYEYKKQSEQHIDILYGSVNVLDKSYVRTLEKLVKNKDELLKYKDEKIQALDEALKKND